MTPLHSNSKVSDWVAKYPRTSDIFESSNIDYCCGGSRSLKQTSQERHLDLQELLTRDSNRRFRNRKMFLKKIGRMPAWPIFATILSKRTTPT
ncbi:MAG: DUF542 domain-containing protein [Planctomycetaceae bacterium]|nr:DUF542 domain-containing protein [Planctomycetaceae bacterium]